MNWAYMGEEVHTLPDNIIGFVYRIVYEDSRCTYNYYGQKLCLSRKKKNFTKKQLSQVTDKRKKTYTYVPCELDWKNYKGSCKDERVDSMVLVEKEILYYCKSKIEMTYLEAMVLFKNDALEDNLCLNSNILGKFYPDKIYG